MEGLLNSRQALEELCKQLPYEPHKQRTEKRVKGAIALGLAGLVSYFTVTAFETPSLPPNIFSLEGLKGIGNVIGGLADTIPATAFAIGAFAFGLYQIALAYTAPFSIHRQDGQVYFKGGRLAHNLRFPHTIFASKVHPVDDESGLEERIKKGKGRILLNGVSLGKRMPDNNVKATFGSTPIRLDTNSIADATTGLGSVLRGIRGTELDGYCVLGDLFRREKDGTYVLWLDYITTAYTTQVTKPM